jgi:RNA polymerase sigma factor (TIGR02999 family)
MTLRGGESEAGESAGVSAGLLAACYDETRRIARRIIASDGAKRPLQATELANEAAIRLMGLDRMAIKDRAHMLAMAARTMRRILIDEARKGSASKRHAPTFVTHWPGADAAGDLIDMVDLDRALEALDSVSPDHAQVIELRFMLGLSVEEAAESSGLSERTIKRRWQAARAWLLDYLSGDGQNANGPSPILT